MAWLKRILVAPLAVACFAAPAASSPPPIASGVWSLGREPMSWQAGPGFAGAISSIRFRGREFIDAADHGRELQGAVQFGTGECLNPTLAGASRDRPGASSSQVLSVRTGPGRYRASTRMAFWKRPGSSCTLPSGARGVTVNRSQVSDLVYSQDMAPGYQGHPNAILARIEIRNSHKEPPAAVEALTGYMPPDFDIFILYDAQNGRFRLDSAQDAQGGELDSPLIVSTANGRSAMGVIGLSAATAPHYAGFHSAAVSKWSVVYYEATPFTPGVHRYDCVWIIGTRREVEETLADIVRRRAAQATLEEALLVAGAGAVFVLGGALLAVRERRRRRHPPVPL